MISESERREVAERLMDNVHEYGTEYNFFLYALGMEREYHGPCDWTKVHERLADLIDPTCEVESSIFDDTCECESPAWGYHLSCGHWLDWGDSEPPSYCPYCGARIIRQRDL